MPSGPVSAFPAVATSDLCMTTWSWERRIRAAPHPQIITQWSYIPPRLPKAQHKPYFQKYMCIYTLRKLTFDSIMHI